MFSIFSPLEFMGLAYESRLKSFLTFIASICWNLVSTHLSLEVQSWGRWWSPFILLTSVYMTAIGHCSCQVEGDRKLMGQPLAHPQRLGPLVGGSNCFFSLGWTRAGCPLSSLFLGPFWVGTLLHFSTFRWAIWPFLCLGLLPSPRDFWTYKMGIKDMLCHGFFTPHGL